MTFFYRGCSLPAEYNYVLTTLCGIYPETLTESFADIIVKRLTTFLETGEINRTPLIKGPRDPFMEFWKVYGPDDDDVILTEDVEFCLEWLGKSDGLYSSSEEQQG
jgi:hypothetical protein